MCLHTGFTWRSCLEYVERPKIYASSHPYPSDGELLADQSDRVSVQHSWSRCGKIHFSLPPSLSGDLDLDLDEDELLDDGDGDSFQPVSRSPRRVPTILQDKRRKLALSHHYQGSFILTRPILIELKG